MTKLLITFLFTSTLLLSIYASFSSPLYLDKKPSLLNDIRIIICLIFSRFSVPRIVLEESDTNACRNFIYLDKLARHFNIREIDINIIGGGGYIHHARTMVSIIRESNVTYSIVGSYLYSAGLYYLEVCKCRGSITGVFHGSSSYDDEIVRVGIHNTDIVTNESLDLIRCPELSKIIKEVNDTCLENARILDCHPKFVEVRFKLIYGHNGLILDYHLY